MMGPLGWAAGPDLGWWVSADERCRPRPPPGGRMSDHGDRVACDHGPAHFRAVAETAQDAIITIDTTGCVLYANPRAVRMFAGITSTLVGSQVTELIPERLRETYRAS